MNKKINNSFVVCRVVYPKNSKIHNSGITERKLNNSLSCFRCKVCEKVFDRKSSLVLHERTHLDDRPLTCKVCQKTFLDKSLLNKHLITQGHAESTESEKGRNADKYKGALNGYRRELSLNKPLKCHICTETFKDELTLKKHLYLHFDNKKSFITVSSKGITDECSYSHKTETKNLSDCVQQETITIFQELKGSKVQLHSVGKTSENDVFQESLKAKKLSQLFCPSEKDSSNCPLSNKSPVLEVGNTSFLCEVCHESFKSDSLLSKHNCSQTQLSDCEVEVLDEKPFQLNIDRKPVPISTNGKKFFYTRRKSLVCSKCQEVFENKSSLALHFCTLRSKKLMKTYDRASKSLKSGVTVRTLENESSLKVSQPIHAKQLICHICKQHFLNKEAFTFHLHCHMEDKFVCENCQTAFNTRKLLEIHRRSIGRKQFTCSICQKVCCSGKNLIDHYDIHRKKEKFHCNVCDKLFKNEFILYLHYFSHTKNVPFFICPVCLEIFSNRNNWISHCCSHIGTKPRICEICKKHFVKRRNYYLHCRIHTDEKPYNCETCHKKFKYNRTLVMHRHVHT